MHTRIYSRHVARALANAYSYLFALLRGTASEHRRCSVRAPCCAAARPPTPPPHTHTHTDTSVNEAAARTSTQTHKQALCGRYQPNTQHAGETAAAHQQRDVHVLERVLIHRRAHDASELHRHRHRHTQTVTPEAPPSRPGAERALERTAGDARSSSSITIASSLS